MVRIRNRGTAAAGIVGPAVLLLVVGLGAVWSPTYSWPGDPVSLIGMTGGWTAGLFNAGLVLGGLSLLPFGARLWRVHSPLTGGLYAVVGLSLSGAGLFPASQRTLHGLFGALVFFGIPAVLWAAGAVDWRAGDRRSGATAFALGATALVVWLPYDFGMTWAQIGYGAAELVSLLALAAWSVLTTVRLRDVSSPRSPDRRRETRS